jgi:hypothetical protein
MKISTLPMLTIIILSSYVFCSEYKIDGFNLRERPKDPNDEDSQADDREYSIDSLCNTDKQTSLFVEPDKLKLLLPLPSDCNKIRIDAIPGVTNVDGFLEIPFPTVTDLFLLPNGASFLLTRSKNYFYGIVIAISSKDGKEAFVDEVDKAIRNTNSRRYKPIELPIDDTLDAVLTVDNDDISVSLDFDVNEDNVECLSIITTDDLKVISGAGQITDSGLLIAMKNIKANDPEFNRVALTVQRSNSESPYNFEFTFTIASEAVLFDRQFKIMKALKPVKLTIENGESESAIKGLDFFLYDKVPLLSLYYKDPPAKLTEFIFQFSNKLLKPMLGYSIPINLIKNAEFTDGQAILDISNKDLTQTARIIITFVENDHEGRTLVSNIKMMFKPKITEPLQKLNLEEIIKKRELKYADDLKRTIARAGKIENKQSPSDFKTDTSILTHLTLTKDNDHLMEGVEVYVDINLAYNDTGLWIFHKQPSINYSRLMDAVGKKKGEYAYLIPIYSIQEVTYKEGQVNLKLQSEDKQTRLIKLNLNDSVGNILVNTLEKLRTAHTQLGEMEAEVRSVGDFQIVDFWLNVEDELCSLPGKVMDLKLTTKYIRISLPEDNGCSEVSKNLRVYGVRHDSLYIYRQAIHNTFPEGVKSVNLVLYDRKRNKSYTTSFSFNNESQRRSFTDVYTNSPELTTNTNEAEITIFKDFEDWGITGIKAEVVVDKSQGLLVKRKANHGVLKKAYDDIMYKLVRTIDNGYLIPINSIKTAEVDTDSLDVVLNVRGYNFIIYYPDFNNEIGEVESALVNELEQSKEERRKSNTTPDLEVPHAAKLSIYEIGKGYSKPSIDNLNIEVDIQNFKIYPSSSDQPHGFDQLMTHFARRFDEPKTGYEVEKTYLKAYVGSDRYDSAVVFITVGNEMPMIKFKIKFDTWNGKDGDVEKVFVEGLNKSKSESKSERRKVKLSRKLKKRV